MKIKIFDTTLRDGAQGAGISFTCDDRIRIVNALDLLGIYCTEGGYFSSPLKTIGGPPQKNDIFGRLDACEHNIKIAAFIGTRRVGVHVYNDENLRALAESNISFATVYGKSSVYHVKNILRTTCEENLNMISDTVSFLAEHGKIVYFDAEHFFDGYCENPSYAVDTLITAVNAGASAVVLCDTNGGTLPDVIGKTISCVREKLINAEIGIHCHNDIGTAVASSVAAVISGASIVQGTVSGIGERCGNANLNTIIPLLQLKLGYDCIPTQSLASLTRQVRYINEIANRSFDESEPFVGGYAFTHKAGTHIDAVGKCTASFEHISPEAVGNSRNILVSGLAGRAAVIAAAGENEDIYDKNDPRIQNAVARIKELEAKGYSYEDAEASLALVIHDALGLTPKKYFDLVRFSVNINEGSYLTDDEKSCAALIKIKVGDLSEITAAEGDGPVNALDLALRRALSRFYPAVEQMRLTDYKVRVLNSHIATASSVRVSIETADDTKIWRTVGVSADIIDASRQALVDAFQYRLAEIYG